MKEAIETAKEAVARLKAQEQEQRELIASAIARVLGCYPCTGDNGTQCAECPDRPVRLP